MTLASLQARATAAIQEKDWSSAAEALRGVSRVSSNWIASCSMSTM